MRLPYSQVSPTSMSGELPSAAQMRHQGSGPADQVEPASLRPTDCLSVRGRIVSSRG
jgi:hypothetical protein